MRMGSESEFGILGGWSLEAASRIQSRVEQVFEHLPATKEGVFLDNGSRVYVDLESHNEYATPELSDPLQLVRHELAGRVLMRESADAVGEVLLCSNLDYASLHAWGTHENYECRAPLPRSARAAMLAHLATRIAYTGAGGPHPRVPGMRLVISPRAALTVSAAGRQGSLEKTMIYRKPDDHGAGHRLHVFCGESLLCPRASWLKYGATALVAHCLDRRLVEPGPLTLRDPLRVLQEFNRDLGLSRRFRMLEGGWLSGLEVQWRFVRAIERVLDRLPAWAPDVLAAWSAMLDRLRTRDRAAHGMLDWLVYRRLWLLLAQEHGFALDELPALQRDAAFGGVRLVATTRTRYAALCADACELYVRMHAMTHDSPFEAARAAGWLEPPLAGLDETQVLEAIRTAPNGRAANRARLVRQLQPRRSFSLSWEVVHDLVQLRSAVIPHEPNWSGELQWQAQEGQEDEGEASPDPATLFRMVAAHRPTPYFDTAFREGDYRYALRDLAEGWPAMGREADPASVMLCHGRLGQRDEALAVLAATPALRQVPFVQCVTELFCAVHYGLVPPRDECMELVRRGEALLPEFSGGVPDPCYHVQVYQQVRGWALLHHGRVEEAIRVLEASVRMLRRESRPRMLARSHCLLAEALRRSGDVPAALRELLPPARTYRNEGMAGDVVDHYIPVFAKLADPVLAEAALRCAEAANRRRAHPLGLARVLCLRARITRAPELLTRLLPLSRRLEVLRECTLLQYIIAHWSAWAAGERPEESGFWGL